MKLIAIRIAMITVGKMLDFSNHIPQLLSWYYAHNRQLPWRNRNKVPNPYHVWLSEIMLQQTTSAAVAPYFAKFLSLWPDVRALANAPLNDVLTQWAGLGYYARARNLHACAQQIVNEYQSTFPKFSGDLQRLKGIGAYTAAAIASICYNERIAVVDGNVMRVIARVFMLEDTKPKLDHAVREILQPLVPAEAGAFGQALMDLGNQICTPTSSKCSLCPLSSCCAAFAHNTQLEYPKKVVKQAKPVRNIAIFAIIKGNQVLLQKRADSGLLAKMTELPSIGWHENFDANALETAQNAPIPSQYTLIPNAYTHVFTHFTAHVSIWVAQVPHTTLAPENTWFCALNALENEALPSIMRKALKFIN